MQKALLLNSNHVPLKVIPWQDALSLIFRDKAYMVDQYTNKFVRTVNQEFPWPAVVALFKYIDVQKSTKFNRSNVFARDRYTCVYCGLSPRGKEGKPKLEQLTFDHVVPRAQAKNGMVTTAQGKRVHITSWQNVVTSCGPCNLKKGARTPKQAGLTIHRIPRKPNPIDAIRMHLTKLTIPSEWGRHLKGASMRWTEYWEEELQET